MSLTVPITTAQMSGGGYSAAASPENMSATGHGPITNPTPTAYVAAGVGSQRIALSAAGWIALGVIGIWALDEWGFQFAHVPV